MGHIQSIVGKISDSMVGYDGFFKVLMRAFE